MDYPAQLKELTNIKLPFGLEAPVDELGDLLLGERLPEDLLPGRRLVPWLHPGEERPRGLHGLHPLLSRRWQHERVELRKLLPALRERLPPGPRARSSLGPERHERGLAERDRACAWGLRVAVLELERRTIEEVGEAPVGDANAGGWLPGVRDGNLLGTAARGRREGRVGGGGGSAALGVVGRLLMVGDGEAEGGREPWTGVLG